VKPDITYIENFPTLLTVEALRDLIDWQQRNVTVYGKTHPQPRLTAWYAPVSYVYGSLLLMGKGTQTDWQHALPRTSRPIGPRVNLTFRLAKT